MLDTSGSFKCQNLLTAYIESKKPLTENEMKIEKVNILMSAGYKNAKAIGL